MRVLVRTLLMLLLVGMPSPPPPLSASVVGASVVVLVSPGAPAYRDACEGALDSLRGYVATDRITTVQLDGSESAERGAELVGSRVSLVLAIGSRAAKLAQPRAAGVPLVYAMVLDPESVGLPAPGQNPTRGATGVTMDVALDRQLETLQEVLPSARRVGVLYDPVASGQTVRRAEATARARGLELVPQAVRSEGEVLAAAVLLVPQVDVLWGLADPTVLTAANARALILLSLRSRKPLFAMSEGYVRSGALAALSPDAREVGRRAGEIARKALAGSPLQGLRPENPPVLSLFVNRATAERLGIALSPAVIARARTVFPER